MKVLGYRRIAEEGNEVIGLAPIPTNSTRARVTIEGAMRGRWDGGEPSATEGILFSSGGGGEARNADLTLAGEEMALAKFYPWDGSALHVHFYDDAPDLHGMFIR